ncbi:ribonuclease H-like domain-containing protein [Tanacetum coccineum]
MVTRSDQFGSTWLRVNSFGSWTGSGQPAILGQISGQETVLPHAFSTMTFQDHTTGAWNMDTDGKLSRYKSRLVANGSTQLEGVDVDETFSPVIKPSSSEILLQQIISSLCQEFAMTDLGSLNYFLGISVTRDSSGLFLSKKKIYDVEVLEMAHMVNCNPSRTPIDTESKLGSDGDPVSDPTLYRSLAGSLQYLTFTRPDISYVVQQIWLLIQMQLGLVVLLLDALLQVTVFFLATTYSLGPLSVSRRFLVPVQRQSIVVLPMLLLRLVGYAIYYVSCTLLYLPLRFFIQYLSCNPVQHQRTKHIEIYIHFVRDLVAAGQVRVLHVPSRYQFADIFTKGLPSALFELKNFAPV